MLNDQLTQYYNQIYDLLNNEIIPKIKEFTKERIAFHDAQFERYNNWKSEVNKVDEIENIFNLSAKFQRENERAINEEREKVSKKDIYQIFNSSIEKINSIVDQAEELVIVNQESQHFTSDEKDPLKQKFYKKVKKTSFGISNTFKKIGKGKDFEYHWKRNIPLKGMLNNFFVLQFLNLYLKIIESYYEKLGLLYINLLNSQKEIDKTFTDLHLNFVKQNEKANLTELQSAYEEKRKLLVDEFSNQTNEELNKILAAFENAKKEFISSFNVIGTWGNPISRFSNSVIDSKKNILNLSLEKSQTHFTSFYQAVFDRVEFYIDLLWFTNLFISNANKSISSWEFYKNNKIKPSTDSIIKEISISKKKLEVTEDSFIETINQEKDNLLNSLDKKLAVDLLNIISNSQYNLHLEEYLNELSEDVNEFEKDYDFVKPSSLKFHLAKNDLKKFSPKEIINPLVIKKLAKVNTEIKTDFISKISKLNPGIINLARIIEFNLESAVSKFSDDEKSEKEAKQIAFNGLDRAKSKIENIYAELDNYYNHLKDELNAKINELLIDLFSFSNIEKLISVRLQVSKEQAIQEVKDNFQLGLTKFADWLKWLGNKIVELFNSAKESVLGISSKVGLSSGETELSEAMADYLVRVSSAIDKLPYVYQRLFSNDEIVDPRIFVGRDAELAKIEKAYGYWINDQISSIMLIGEKGSGTSSLINVALKKINPTNKIFRNKFHGTIYKEEDLLKYLCELLGLSNIKSIDELIEKLNNSDERIVIIIENLEDFFLRIVDGFDAINKLLEVITSTNRNVLWLLTCNTFAWNYLNKILQTKDFFIFNVYLRELEEPILEEAILVRHNVSGYNIRYLPTASLEKQKSFNKLNDKEQQEYLQKEYFDKLHRVTSNNIGIALFLWLRSIKDSDENEIKISSSFDLDFSFLNELSDEKLFSIMAIILHDGISIEEHSQIFNSNIKSSQLMFATLADDGIIFKRGNLYKVNFQLYKPLVNLLRSKNIIH